MKKRRVSLVGVALVVLIALVILFLVRLTMRSTPEILLPTFDDSSSGSDAVSDDRQESIRRVEVTPDSVQLVIEGLTRPENYSRVLTVTRYWSGGSGESRVSTAAADGWTRLDLSEGGVTRHVITGPEHTYVWYGEETTYFVGASALTADEEESIPTYENILALPVRMISAADYRTRDGVNCIYVETRPDDESYTERFWISVDNGLLIAAERLQGETMVYAMTGMEVTTDGVESSAFTLPDGTVLFDPAG